MLTIADKTFHSRLFLGTGKFASSQLMAEAVRASGSQLVTLALKRLELDRPESDSLLSPLLTEGLSLLPNTSGARTAREAILAAIETLEAATELVRRGFVVLPYVQADPVLCKRLEEAGCATVMPLAAPIGSNRGLDTRELLRIIIAESSVPVVVDAGLGSPSHAAECMELGADAVLVNTAIATAADPVAMAEAFRLGVEAGRKAYEARLAPQRGFAQASSPLTAFLS